MRAAGLSVYYSLPSLNKVDTYIHQSKKCAKLMQAGCHGKQGDNYIIIVNNQLLAIDYYTDMNSRELGLRKSYNIDYSNRTEWAIDNTLTMSI